MAHSRKVIITCAVTGAIHTPSMSPHLPVTAEEIATTAIEAAEAGAAVIHLTRATKPRASRTNPPKRSAVSCRASGKRRTQY